MNTELATIERKKHARFDKYISVDGPKLRQVRQHLGITMKRAAERSGAGSKENMYAYEMNIAMTPEVVAERLCEIYGIPLESILLP